MTGRGLRFVVQEHKSRRHHYDFRLEVRGVLRSWAVPKGPSMNPTDKRLAIMVPDHPFEYLGFEGVIPEGRAGAGPVVIWDSGKYAPIDTDDPEAALATGRLSFELRGKKLKGFFALARMTHMPNATGKEWLLMKKKDRYAVENYEIETALTPERLGTLTEKTPPCETE